MTDAQSPTNVDASTTPPVEQFQRKPLPQIIDNAVRIFFMKDNIKSRTSRQIEFDLLHLINSKILQENENTAMLAGSDKTVLRSRPFYSMLSSLPPAAIAACLMHRHKIARIALSSMSTDPSYDVTAIYMSSGVNEGIYVSDEITLRSIARQYNYNLSADDFKAVMTILGDQAPRVSVNQDRDLIAVNNGIFNYATKKLQPFTPDIVFTAKSAVNWKENPTNPIIHNDEDGTDWDVESWMRELSSDPEIVELLWEIMSAIVRPNVAWDKTAWFLSEVGNNGKGTLLTLMRNLCGERSWTSIPVADFSKDFHLEPLTRANAVLVDENDVGEYVDKAANFKAVVTNDVILINRKYLAPIAYQFHGFMVQCVNDTPRFRDKSGSLYRRQLIIPFDKSFTGRERRYIKHDYMARQDVLEYVLHRVLAGNFYELSEPAAVVNALEDYKVDNDPVRGFLREFSDQFVWDLLPWKFLYALYRAWLLRDQPSTPALGYNRFVKHLSQVVADTPGCEWKPTLTAIRTDKRIVADEPLCVEFNLSNWTKVTTVKGGKPTLTGTPIQLPVSTRGLLREGSIVNDELQQND